MRISSVLTSRSIKVLYAASYTFCFLSTLDLLSLYLGTKIVVLTL
jgi:hypothetical protein